MTDREKTIFELHKQFLHLHYKVTEYEMAGIEPPDHLWAQLKDIESKMQLFPDSLE